jgi:phospholipid/cholesterol/gamma-HCH transport system substrate-binding protein
VRRIVVIVVVLCAAVAAAAYARSSGATSSDNPKYTVELDNAFGVVRGADLKVAGVRAGKIDDLRLDPKSHRALVDFEITQDGFGSLRKDVFCESRPQSLIGEYYIDCKPGKSDEKLKPGATIPVAQTASTIPLDLVNNILRKPYRERLAIVLDELGIGVAGRAQDINDVIRRASPALRETDAVLDKLSRQNETLKQLITDADTVVGDLAANRKDVGRFVVETKNAASASAERREDLAAGIRRLPTFLRELRPTMADLGAAADANTPALRNLDASAGQLATLLENVKPFSEATQDNLESLAEAARKGRPAVSAARPVVAELTKATAKAPELANNAAISLEHLDDRKYAAEKDPRSPGGQGYTGLEAPLQWIFDQSQAINIFDENGYMLKVSLFHSQCSDYQNLQSLKQKMASDPNFYKECAAVLGPNQPGITTPDPTSTGRQFASDGTAQAKSEPKKQAPAKKQPEKPQDSGQPKPTPTPAPEAPKLTPPVDVDKLTHSQLVKLRKRAIERLRDAARQGTQNVGKLRKRLEDQLGIKLPPLDKLKLPEPGSGGGGGGNTPAPSTPQLPVPSFPTPAPNLPVPKVPNVPDPTGQLLDYLLGP